MSIPLKGLQRETTDKFYTKEKVVNQCLQQVRKKICIDYNKDLIIEPSAGSGAFMKGITSLCKNFKFYDLLPDHESIEKLDYLTLTQEIYNNWKQDFSQIHVIGNPPFGRQSSLALKFIRLSCLFCDTLSFILPKSFKKDSMKQKIPQYFHLVYEFELSQNSFEVDGEEHDVPCIFQIWEKRQEKREINDRVIPNLFNFVKKNEQPHISFRRVGVYAGRIDIVTDEEILEQKSAESHYFIRFTNDETIENNVEKLKDLHFNNKNDTVGPKSISKQELIKIFNLKLNCD